jgi:hypothetical protein
MRPSQRKGTLVLASTVVINAALAVVTAGQLPPCSAHPGKALPSRCELIDERPPRRLEGGVDDAQYCFGHVSDAEHLPGTNSSYRHWLINWHDTNILSAEWAKVDITFRDIAPRDCALQLRSTGLPPREDKDAPVRYGRVKDKLIAKNAAAYVQDAAVQTKSYPSLTSTVYAGLLLTGPTGPARFVVDITTRSEFKGQQIQLQVENRGDPSLIYSVPELATRLGKARFDAAVDKSTWRRVAPGSDWFQVSGGVNVANLLVNDIGTAAEAPLVLQFARIDAPGAILGRVSVPAYLPPIAPSFK